ncbi:MAG: hypothetical protein DK841_02615 [Candidatus Melainabacteria bacterium]|nr:MAG: hypothetical protein DK841_02615 [Candidatus Melainabacteria bacterium]
MNNKKIKLIAISVAMVLSTQMVLAEDLITDFGGLTDALKNATGSSVTVKLGSDISANVPIKIGNNTPISVTILGENKTYRSTTLAFDVQKNTEFTLNNITLEDIKHGSLWGGAIYNEGTLTLDNVTFNNNISQETSNAVGGGAMALVATKGNAVSTTIKNSTFTNNSTETRDSYKNNGGAIYVYGTSGQVGNNTLNISDSRFESNHTNKTGGAIGVNNLGPSDFEIEIKHTTFTENKSTGYGGAIDVTTGDTGGTGNVTLKLDHATFNGNESGSDGGAIAYEKGNITSNIINSTFKNNTANNGGAIYNGIKDLKISNTTFDGNKTNDGGKGGAIYNAGNISLNQTEFKQSTDTIYMANDSFADFSDTNILNGSISSENATSKIKNKGTLILNADNSGYTGTYTQESGQTDVNESSTFFGGETTIADGVLNWNTLKNYNSTLKVEKGSLNIGNVNKASLSLNNNSYIKKDTLVNINSKGEIKLNGGSITLDDNDIWAGNISIGDENTVGSGTLTIDGLTSNGGIFANGGTIDIISGRLTASAGDVIKEATTVKIKDDALLAVRRGDVTLGATGTNSDTWSGNVILREKGHLTAGGFNSNGKLLASGGTLDVVGGRLNVIQDSIISKEVKTTIYNDSELSITNGGIAQINDNDQWEGKVSLNGGRLDLIDYDNTTTQGQGFEANTGNLNISNTTFNMYDDYTVAKDVDVVLSNDSKAIFQNGSEFNLNENDYWGGSVEVVGGHLIGSNIHFDGKNGAKWQQSSGTSTFNNSYVELNDENSFIGSGDLNLINSGMRFGADSISMSADNLYMKNSSINTLNGWLEEHEISSNMNVNGTNHFGIDVAPRLGNLGESDLFTADKIISDNNGTINIADFNFVGLAPIDRQLRFRVFTANQIDDKVNFTATNKEIFTPIGYYNLQSAGGSWYTSNMTRYNPQVFRGQVATLASYNNQLMIDDMLLNHVTLDSERLLAQSKNANIYASTLPQFAPYQYKKEDGGLWYKSYVNFENLSLTQGLKVGNNSYGSLVGADFPVIKLKHGWRLMPTAYIGYNGAHQTFNGVGMYQNGGQGGLMGTFMKDNFIGSVVAYGGGYNNEMSVAGNTDRAGNWFAGTAAKLAYNFHPTKHFTIQPTAFMSYNIFGRQNWGTDFGSMSMNSGLLNGINVAPGMNFIYAKETWSVYATFQYMYNINEQVGGRAGNVDLASVKMEHGYIQYGLGVTKTWKDRLNSFFQIVFRNGGRTGVGFQLGLNYTFDWLNPSKTKSTKATKAKKIKSNKQSMYQQKGEKTIIKSLSMK